MSLPEKFEDAKKFAKYNNPFQAKYGDVEIKWKIVPKASLGDVVNQDWDNVKYDLLHKSKASLSIKAAISDDTDFNFKFKGNFDNQNINFQITKKF